MTREETPGLRPVMLVLGAMFAFSLMVIFTRGSQANILGVAAWRAIIVALVFGVSAFVAEGGSSALQPDKTTWKLGAWLGLALAIASSTFVGGYALTTVANTIFLHNLAPVAVFPLAWWLYKERPGAGSVTGAGIALFGVALLSGVSLFQVSHFASSRFLLGDFLSLVSAGGYAAVLVLTRMTRREQTPILGTLFVAWAIAAVLLSLVATAFGGFLVPAGSMMWIVGLAVISTCIPFYLLNLGMKSVPAGMAAVLSLSEVLFATFIGLFVYGEQLAPIGWIGGALAGLGVLYAITQRTTGSDAVAGGTILPEAIRTQRMVRAGFGLLLLNAGVVLQWVFGVSSGGLFALIGLAILGRYGPSVGTALLEGRFAPPMRWLGLLLGGVVAWAAFRQAGDMRLEDSLSVAVLAAVFVLIERRLVRGEPESSRDTSPFISLAIGSVALAHVFGLMEHQGSVVLIEASNLFAGAAGLVAVLAAVSGGSLTEVPGLPSVEGRFSTWFEGRRPLGVVAVLWVLGAVHLVPTGHVGIVERFGEPVGQTEEAGLFLRLPPPIETFSNVDVGAETQVNIGAHTLLTGDQSMVSLEAVLRYAVSDASAFAYNTVEPEEALSVLARAVLVEVVAHQEQDSVLTTGRVEVESVVRQLLQERADSVELGIEVAAVHLTKVAVPPPVLASFLDVISADEEQLTRVNQAEAYMADLIPRTRGQALASIVQAQGDAVRIRAKAIGYDVWFRSIQRNSSASMALTRSRLAFERVEADLEGVRLVAAPAGVRVWVGDEGHWPKDVSSESNNGGGRR